jgi:hypothetical protein
MARSLGAWSFYQVRYEQYERGMAKKWSPGDRIRMFFGGKVRETREE